MRSIKNSESKLKISSQVYLLLAKLFAAIKPLNDNNPIKNLFNIDKFAFVVIAIVNEKNKTNPTNGLTKVNKIDEINKIISLDLILSNA